MLCAAPHENWQYIRWDADVSLPRIATMLQRQPGYLMLDQYPMPAAPTVTPSGA